MRKADGAWAVIVHGGARPIAEARRPAFERGCLLAVEAARHVLEAGGEAVAAAEAAVRVLEDNPVFNAGLGSVLNAAGEVECDAAIMDGRTLAAGAVAAVRTLRHPVSVARSLLDDRAILLVGEGAETYAASIGAEPCSPAELRAAASSELEGCDTVGCVALDRRGSIAAATSTGGLSGARPGRVGDSPLPGLGLYADDTTGGVSLSGEGEAIIRAALAAHAAADMATMTAKTACETALLRLSRVGGEAGLIAIDARGEVGWAHNSPQFAVAWAREGGAPQAFTEAS